MRKQLIASMTVIGAFCVSPVFAQQDASQPSSEEILFFMGGSKQPGETITGLFIETQSLHFQDPRAPRFLLVDQKRQIALGIGGYVKLTTSYDFAGISDNVDFIPYNIPVPNDNANNGQYQMDVSTSRLYLKLVGNNKALGKFSAYIETDFRGHNHTLRLRQAYVSARGFLLGQSWSTFSDLAALPPTIDFQGPNGNTDIRNVQIRYTHNFAKNWQAALAIEAPSLSVTTNNFTRTIKQRMPDIPMYIQYGWGKQSHVRLSGIFRGLSYRDMIQEKNKMDLGWGVQLSGLANLTSKALLFYQGTYGKGISQYIVDINGVGLDLVPNQETVGRLQALPSFAVVGGLQYQFTKKLFASASYSQVRLYSENGYYNANGYKYAQYVVGNLFWNVTSSCQLGVEYLYGRRVNMDKDNGHANRVQAMIQYNF